MQGVPVVHIGRKAVFHVENQFDRTDIFPPEIGEADRIRAPVKERRAEPLFDLSNRVAE